jgi:hypothetical protein
MEFKKKVLETLDKVLNADPEKVRAALAGLVSKEPAPEPPKEPVKHSSFLKLINDKAFVERVEAVHNGGPGSGRHKDERFEPQPPPTMLPPTMDTARKIADMSPSELHQHIQSFNRINLEIGKNASDEDVEELKGLAAKARTRLELVKTLPRTEENLNSVAILSSLEQFYNEAVAEHDRHKLANAGTSEGVKKAWVSRKHGEETDAERTDRLAGQWAHRWSWKKDVGMPQIAPYQRLQQFKPDKPVTLYRFERADHDPNQSDFKSAPFQSWSRNKDMVHSIVEDSNATSDPNSPKLIAKEQTFHPDQIFTDFTLHPESIKKHAPDNAMDEVLVWKDLKHSEGKVSNAKEKEGEKSPELIAVAAAMTTDFKPVLDRINALIESGDEQGLLSLRDDLTSLNLTGDDFNSVVNVLSDALSDAYFEGIDEATGNSVEKKHRIRAYILGSAAYLSEYTKPVLDKVAADIKDRAKYAIQTAQDEILGHILNELHRIKDPLSDRMKRLSDFLSDLSEAPQVIRAVEMNRAVVKGYGGWLVQRTMSSLERVPCYEFYREEDRKEWRPWPDMWIAAGGPPLIPDPGSDYPEGRMIAPIQSDLWGNLNQISPGDPFPPYAWGSGMSVIPRARQYCIDKGAIPEDYVPTQPPLVGLNDNLKFTDEIRNTAKDIIGKLSNAEYTDPNPTDAQKTAGNYAKRDVDVHGLKIAIENEKGGERSGRDRDGGTWSTIMPAAYGYVKGTEGYDGDPVDVYLNEPVDPGHPVIIVDQQVPDTGVFDEHKAMLGFHDADAALDVYRGAFSDGKGQDRIGGVTMMSLEDFQKWLDGDTSQPLKMTNADIPMTAWKQGDWPQDDSDTIESDGPGVLQGDLFLKNKKCGESGIPDSYKCRIEDGFPPIPIRKIAGIGLSRARAQKEAADIATSIFGATRGVQGAVRAAGATAGDKVRLQIWKDTMEVWVSGEKSAQLMEFRRGSKEAHLVQLIVSEPGAGTGTKLFSRIVDGCRGLGKISLEAVRDDKNGLNGYYTWPRLGCVSNEDDPVLEKMAGVKRVDQLMGSKEGRDWWKANGYTTKLHFDLTPRSYSNNVFNAYRSARGL